MADDDVLIDEFGGLYRKAWHGGYVPDIGWMGHKRDLNSWGMPNIESGFFGPVPARDPWGQPIYSVRRPAALPAPVGPGNGVGDREDQRNGR
ncbi:MAG: hypothetical protein RMJ48_01665 [Roseiflexaceae bacterium]|nr:hypothetical protein [Roseiflexaceae bacterium]